MNLERMSHEQFLALVVEWSKRWLRLREDGEPYFGDEVSLEDWLGSIESYAVIGGVAEKVEA